MTSIADQIQKLWFDSGRIIIMTAKGRQLSLPLEISPALYYADDFVRNDYYLWDNNQSIRWESIDEDIHISHFLESVDVNYDNPVNAMLSAYGPEELKQLAQRMDIHWSLLARMKFGVAKSNPLMIQRLQNFLANPPMPEAI